MIEFVSITAGAFELLAVFLLARKNILGWPSGIVGNVLWMSYAIHTGTAYGLMLVCPVVFVLNLYGFWRWQRC